MHDACRRHLDRHRRLALTKPAAITGRAPSLRTRSRTWTSIWTSDRTLETDDAARADNDFNESMEFASSRSGPLSAMPSVDLPSLDLDMPSEPGRSHSAGRTSTSTCRRWKACASRSAQWPTTAGHEQEMDLSAIGLDLAPSTHLGPVHGHRRGQSASGRRWRASWTWPRPTARSATRKVRASCCRKSCGAATPAAAESARTAGQHLSRRRALKGAGDSPALFISGCAARRGREGACEREPRLEQRRASADPMRWVCRHVLRRHRILRLADPAGRGDGQAGAAERGRGGVGARSPATRSRPAAPAAPTPACTPLRRSSSSIPRAERPASAWVRGVNAWLPPEAIAVRWAGPVAAREFDARFGATARTYWYVLSTRRCEPRCGATARAGATARSMPIA